MTRKGNDLSVPVKEEKKKNPVICLIGPTAVGKTTVSLELARRLPVEIVSCDSMQVYRGMDIGTSKPPLSFRRKTPHHLIDILDPDEEYNLARFLELVTKTVSLIHRRRRLPLVVGGSGLYLRALTRGLFPGVGADWDFRRRLEEQVKMEGSEKLYQRLKEVDPAAAERIHPHNLRRLIRALEVYEKTGKPISRWQAGTRGIAGQYRLEIFGMIREKNDLGTRIDRRVDEMLAEGLVGEVKALTASGRLGNTARQALGYREAIDFLEGRCLLEEARERIKKNTRLFARRQMTWFRKEERVCWLEVAADEPPRETAERILGELRSRKIAPES